MSGSSKKGKQKRERDGEGEKSALVSSLLTTFRSGCSEDFINLALFQVENADFSSGECSELLFVFVSFSPSSSAHGEALVQSLLDKGANPNTKRDGMSVLHHAALKSSPAVVACLLKAGASVVALSDKVGRTPLEMCCCENRWDVQTASVAQILLRAVEATNDISGYRQCLIRGCRKSSFDVIAVLSNSPFFAQVCNKQFMKKRMTVVMAVCMNRIAGWRAVQLVLSLLPKSLITKKDANGETALTYACSFGNHDMVRTLLSFAPKLVSEFRSEFLYKNDADPLGVLQAVLAVSVKTFARVEGVDSVIQKMSESKKKQSDIVLWAFFRTGYPPIATEDFNIEDSGPFMDGHDKGDMDPALPVAVLDFAARINDEKIWRIVEGELSMFRQSTNGRTILHHAARLGNIELMQRLMLRRINPFIPSKRGNLAIDFALNDEVSVVLQKYMKWDPKLPNMREWYGPVVYQRTLCFLLVLLRYEPFGPRGERMPKDVRLIILNMIVNNEVIYLKKFPRIEEFRGVWKFI
jgi:ankyrin repeat protein